MAKPAQRFRNASSAYTASVDLVCAAAFLEARQAVAPGSDHGPAQAAERAAADVRAQARTVHMALTAARPDLHPRAAPRLATFLPTLASVAGAQPLEEPGRAIPMDPLPHHTACLQPFPHSSHMFLASLHAGWDLSEALALWSPVQLGSFSKHGKTFYPGPRTPQQGPFDWTQCQVRSFPRAPGEAPVCVFSLAGSIRAISSTASLQVAAPKSAPSRLGLANLPDFIALPRDEAGRPIIPKSRVTALVEAQEAWHTELGSLDHVTSTIVRGRLVMPKITTPSQCKVLRNHPSWEDDPAAQAALGPIIATWLAQGVLEYVQWDDRHPVLLQPCGAVPKGTAPFYRLITDARFGNTMYSDWGVNYTSAADLSAALSHRCFTWSSDLKDAYHLSVFAGCGGALKPIKRPLVHGDGTISWIDGFVNGCTPSSCLGGCDKDMSGLHMNGHIFRFAACQFGQKTAGSPLNSIVMSVARYFGRLPDPIHVAAWVDDLHFTMKTPPHPPCLGHTGGCQVCAATYIKAAAAEKLWHAKAKALNLPLADGKGHTAAQGGAFTGIGIDTFAGLYTMLPDKLAGLHTNFDLMTAITTSTPRALARTRGKAQHYGCAIQYLRPACASLTQAIHQAERPGAPAPPDLSAEATDPEFNWDQQIPVSTRARAAIACLQLALGHCGHQGQPLWPTPSASLFGAFLAGPSPRASPFVLTVFAFAHGWGFTLRDRPGLLTASGHGSWTAIHTLLQADWMAPGDTQASGAPACPTQRHAIACLLSLHAASLQQSLRTRPLLIRCASDAALLALRKGAPHCSTLQDISMLFQTACILLQLSQPAFLVTPFGLQHRVQPPNAAALVTSDASAPALRTHAHRLASRLGRAFTLDLFATSCHTLTPRFYSQWPEPEAEAVDALAQPDWSQSHCPTCQAIRPDFVYLFPPFALLPAALQKAQHDQAQGVLVVPYAASAAWWPAILRTAGLAAGARPPRLACHAHHIINQSNPAGHYFTILPFDFWQGLNPRARPCIHAHAHRGLSSARFRLDNLDVQALRDTLDINPGLET